MWNLFENKFHSANYHHWKNCLPLVSLELLSAEGKSVYWTHDIKLSQLRYVEETLFLRKQPFDLYLKGGDFRITSERITFWLGKNENKKKLYRMGRKYMFCNIKCRIVEIHKFTKITICFLTTKQNKHA